jgi:hypothetical protein
MAVTQHPIVLIYSEEVKITIVFEGAPDDEREITAEVRASRAGLSRKQEDAEASFSSTRPAGQHYTLMMMLDFEHAQVKVDERSGGACTGASITRRAEGPGDSTLLQVGIRKVIHHGRRQYNAGSHATEQRVHM